MMRAPFQVLVFPYFKSERGLIEYAVFRRADTHDWQAIAGGGEEGETPQEAARREIQEEAGIQGDCTISELASRGCVPIASVTGENARGDDTCAIPEYTFTVRVDSKKLSLSREHTEYKWVKYDVAMDLLKWQSNKNALRELNDILTRNHSKTDG